MPEPGRKPGRSRDSTGNVLLVAITMSLVASVLVSATTIVLKPVQERNEARYRQQIILDVAGLWSPGADVDELFERIDTRMVDLATGEYTDAPDPGSFDADAAAGSAEFGKEIAAGDDLANIHRRARYSPVYLVHDGGKLTEVILPVHGKGLWSTMYGFLALAPDGNTIRGLNFYQHGETPGLGAQVDRPDWRALWVGKQLYGADGRPRVAVVRGRADPASPNAAWEVDGLSGATLTGRGVTNLIHYWAGPDGFGPYLGKLRAEAAGDD